jgi:hypothetical protein
LEFTVESTKEFYRFEEDERYQIDLQFWAGQAGQYLFLGKERVVGLLGEVDTLK